MKATPEDVAKCDRVDREGFQGVASMKATPEDVAKDERFLIRFLSMCRPQ